MSHTSFTTVLIKARRRTEKTVLKQQQEKISKMSYLISLSWRDSSVDLTLVDRFIKSPSAQWSLLLDQQLLLRLPTSKLEHAEEQCVRHENPSIEMLKLATLSMLSQFSHSLHVLLWFLYDSLSFDSWKYLFLSTISVVIRIVDVVSWTRSPFLVRPLIGGSSIVLSWLSSRPSFRTSCCSKLSHCASHCSQLCDLSSHCS